MSAACATQTRVEARTAKRAREEARAQLAEQLFAGAKPADARHPFLAAKRVGPYGLRMAVHGQTLKIQTPDRKTKEISIAGRLLVPLRDMKGRLRNVQTITAEGVTFYLGGAQRTGTFHVLGEVRSDAPIIVAERYATAATIHGATRMTVVMALDASNLAPIAAALRARNPSRPIYLAADTDEQLPLRRVTLPNTGRDKTNAVAVKIGATVLRPKPIPERRAMGRGTDWNDYGVHYGLAATARALQAAGLDRMEG